MLYRLIIQNYKSFRDRNEFSMIPDENAHHASYQNSSYPVLRDAIIYGANAAGKSNVVKAISFLQRVVVTNKIQPLSSNLAFRLDKEIMESPSLFLVEIRLGEELYQFGLVISFKKSEICAEWLKKYSETSSSWEEIYTRYCNNETGGNEIYFHYDEKSLNAPRYQTYRQDIQNSNKTLILSELAKKDLSDDLFISAINDVYKWFEQLIVIFPETKYNLLGRVANDLKAVNELYKKYFKIFGIDIEEIRLTSVSEKYLDFPNDMLEELQTDLTNESTNNSIAMIHGNSQDYLAMLDSEKNLTFSEVSFVHKYNEQESEFSIAEESDGTQRLFDLIPMLGYIIDSDRVAVIDEIDRSLHCLLTRQIYRYFLEQSAERHSQLICTTHQVLLMDLNLLGRKEIWFVEKKDKASRLYPLDQYRFDGEKINLADNYLIGRFGAIPKY